MLQSQISSAPSWQNLEYLWIMIDILVAFTNNEPHYLVLFIHEQLSHNFSNSNSNVWDINSLLLHTNATIISNRDYFSFFFLPWALYSSFVSTGVWGEGTPVSSFALLTIPACISRSSSISLFGSVFENVHLCIY